MVYAGIPERKTKLQHNPDIRGDQDNQDNPGKKQAYYSKFFVNEQQSDHKVHQSQESAACETSKLNLDKFSSFNKTSPDNKANPANCPDISCLSLEHHKITRKHSNYSSQRSRDHCFLPSSIDKQSHSFHGYKTENDKDFDTLEKDKHCSEMSKSEINNAKRLSFRKKKTLDSIDDANAKSLYFLPDDTPELHHENQQILNSSDSKKEIKISKPGLFQRISRNLNFFTKDIDSNQENSKRENTNAPLTATERCEYYCSQVYPKDQVFLDEYPILRNGQELMKMNNWNQNEKNQNVKNLNMIMRREKMNDCQLEEENQRTMFWEMFQEKSENEKKSYMNYSVDYSDRDCLTHVTTSGNKDSLEIGYSISQLGTYCLRNPNNLENIQVTETMTAGESWERCLGWITKVDLDALSQGTNSSDSIGHAKPQGKLDIIKGILLDIFVCICF